METFSALLALCVGNSTVTGEIPSQRSVTHIFDIFFDLCLNKWLSKHSLHQWFEMPLLSLWHHCNGTVRDDRIWILNHTCKVSRNFWESPEDQEDFSYKFKFNCGIKMIYFNTLRLIQNDSHFVDDIFKILYKYESFIFIQMSLKSVPIVQFSHWWPSLLTHTCVTQPSSVNPLLTKPT